MSSSTTRYGFTYPQSGDSTNVPVGIQTPLSQIDAIVVTETSGTGPLPAAGIFGRRYYNTSTGREFLDLGAVTGWVSIGPVNVNSGNIQQSSPGAGVSSGSTGLTADAGHIHAREAVATTADIQAAAMTASIGSTGRWVDAGHVHPGGPSLGDLKWTANTTGTYAYGWVPAVGTEVSKTGLYQPFFAACGGDSAYPWGWGATGNNTGTTFNLPDFRDRAPVGSGLTYALGTRTGSATVQLTTSNLPTHEHPIAQTSHSHGVTDLTHNHNIGSNVYINNTGSTVGPVPAGGFSGTSGLYTGQLTTASSAGVSVDSRTTGATTTSGTVFSNTAFSNVQPIAAAICLVKAY